MLFFNVDLSPFTIIFRLGEIR